MLLNFGKAYSLVVVSEANTHPIYDPVYEGPVCEPDRHEHFIIFFIIFIYIIFFPVFSKSKDMQVK